MTLTTIYHISPSEQQPLRDYDLLQLRDLAPILEPALMELQYRRTQDGIREEELMLVTKRLGDLEDV